VIAVGTVTWSVKYPVPVTLKLPLLRVRLSPTVKSDVIMTLAGRPTQTVPLAPTVSVTAISPDVPDMVTLPPPPPDPPGVKVTTAEFVPPTEVGSVYVVFVLSDAGRVTVFKFAKVT
jgi:hypothetical protein